MEQPWAGEHMRLVWAFIRSCETSLLLVLACEWLSASDSGYGGAHAAKVVRLSFWR